MCITSLDDIIVNSKLSLSYSLSESYKSIFSELCDIFNSYDYKVFLFGSFAKGMIHRNSDIDLLLIIPSVNLEHKSKRKIKNELDDALLSLMVKYDIEIDLKIHGEINFINSSKVNYFEGSIIKDLILLERVI